MCGGCGDNEDLKESFSKEVLKFIETHSKSVYDVKNQWAAMMGVMKETDALLNLYLDKVIEKEQQMNVEEEEETGYLLRNAFRLSIDKGKVFCSPVPESEVEAMVEKSRPYGYQIAYNLLQIQSKPFKSTVANGGFFYKTIGGKRKRFETYYDRNTWVVLVRFAEYIKNLEWKWGEYAVVEIVALAATDFEIKPNNKRQTSDEKKNKVQRFTLDGSDHEALCTLDGIDDTITRGVSQV
jgi:hypothetical protein